MNAKTEKRLSLMAAFLLTAAVFIAPNPIQQQQKLHFLSAAEQAVPLPLVIAQNIVSGKVVH